MCEETPNVDRACWTYLVGVGVKRVGGDLLLGVTSHGRSVCMRVSGTNIFKNNMIIITCLMARLFYIPTIPKDIFSLM